jgi:hypothetical protein
MIDIQSVTAIASLVVSIIGLFPRKSRDQTKEQKEAIAAVADAYYTTGRYLERRETQPQDKEHEWEIAQKWDHAARLLEPFDPEGKVYQRLNLKSRFWTEGADWDSDRIESSNIGLSSVWRDVQALLEEKA